MIRRSNPFGELLSLRQAVDGLLQSTIPKAEKSKPRQIHISPMTDAQRVADTEAAMAVAPPQTNGK